MKSIIGPFLARTILRTPQHAARLFFLSMLFLYSSGCKKSDPSPPLNIAGFSPSQGPENTVVTMTGTGFSATLSNDHVFFNGKEAVVTSASSTQLVATVPRQAGTGIVSVVVNGKTQTGAVFTYQLSDAQVTTLAGSGAVGTADGTGTAASFDDPTDLAIDANGNLYVTDEGSNRIRKVTPAGVVTTYAGGTLGYLNSTGPNARFHSPNGLTIDAAGNLYVTDEINCVIRKITPDGAVATLAGTGVQGYVDGPAATAQFANPGGLTIDAAGNIYVSDHYSLIRKITPAGTVSTLAGMTVTGYVDGPATSAEFFSNRGLIMDHSGNLFVTEEGNNLIRKITTAGIVSTWAGSIPGGYADGVASVAKFNYPYSLAIDSSGNLLVADFDNNCIRLITPAGIVSTVAGNPTSGYADGNKATARFNGAAGIVVDKSGAIYIADFYNQRIRKIVLE